MTPLMTQTVPPLPAVLPLDPDADISALKIRYDRSVTAEPLVLPQGGSDYDHAMPSAIVAAVTAWLQALAAIGLVPNTLEARIPVSCIHDDRHLPHITRADVAAVVDQLRSVLASHVRPGASMWLASSGDVVRRAIPGHEEIPDQIRDVSLDLISDWALDRRPWFAASLGRRVFRNRHGLRCEGYRGHLTLNVPVA